jgi:hypothetical protein
MGREHPDARPFHGSGGSWSPLARANDSAPPGWSSVVAFCAVCDVPPTVGEGAISSFSVSEFAVLASGDHVLLRSDLGWSVGPDGASPHGVMTPSELLQQMEWVLIPDDDDSPDERDWEELAFRCRALGLEFDSDAIRGLPYQKLLTDRAIARLGDHPA